MQHHLLKIKRETFMVVTAGGLMEPTKMLVIIRNKILLFIPSKHISIDGYNSFSLVPYIELEN